MTAMMPTAFAVIRLRNGTVDMGLGRRAGGLGLGMTVFIQGVRHHITAPDQTVGQDREECEDMQETNHGTRFY